MMHVFFDLDGTLTDPREGIVACIQYALSSLEIEVDRNINLESFIGPPLLETFRQLCGDDRLAEKAVALYRERFSDIGLYENFLYDGIAGCLDKLKAQVQSIFVVTSKPTVYSKRIVEHFDIQKYFRTVYGSNLDGSLVDKTELLEYVLKSERIDPLDAIMVGDRKFDIIGAKHHGIKTVGVSWGYGSIRELQDAGADSICHHPDELYEHIFS
jgi:phosphoglycolate phosphatase